MEQPGAGATETKIFFALGTAGDISMGKTGAGATTTSNTGGNIGGDEGTIAKEKECE